MSTLVFPSSLYFCVFLMMGAGWFMEGVRWPGDSAQRKSERGLIPGSFSVFFVLSAPLLSFEAGCFLWILLCQCLELYHGKEM